MLEREIPFMATHIESGPPSSARPTGTVTFLFSDIEGSTSRWEGDREAMASAVARHDALMRVILEARGAYVFKTVGDAFCAAFSTAADAVLAAVDAQQALAGEDFSAVNGLRVRIGVHTGEAEERNGDYFGPDVNRVARLMSIGHGGQVLISSGVQERIEGALVNGVSLVDLGMRRLKDLTQPEHVWQLNIAGLPSEFPPLHSLDARPNNLPVQGTALIGRERDLDDLKALIGKQPLVTITGSGGVGKTRVALQLGADLIDRFDDGVWFADLAPIMDPALVSSVIAKVLGITRVEERGVDEAILQWLRNKKLLLILDNCEHLLEAVAGIAESIVRHCHDVRLQATSRQALGIRGEVVHRLPSLALPGAIELFVDRAQAADTHFSLSENNAPVVAEICRRLDGIPLAIELAAARVRVLSIPHLAQRLNERFKILTRGTSGDLPRQKTLGALIDWSYDLLTAQEQILFNRLGIFAGSFSFDATAAVCGSEGVDESDILDLLSSLTDKSLIGADTTQEQERYRLLESTRAYATDKLTASGEYERLARRHAEYFRDEAQAADKRYGVGSTAAWLTCAESELDNYRAALGWALTGGHDPALGAAMAGTLARLWQQGGLIVEGRYWIGLAQATLDESAHPQVAAKMLVTLAIMSAGKQMYDPAERAAALYRSLGDSIGEAWALRHAAFALFQMGRPDQASEAIVEALATMRRLHDNVGEAECLNVQATISMLCRDIVGARAGYAQALAAHKALGNESGAAAVLMNLAELEFDDGRFGEALALGVSALEVFQGGKNTKSLTVCHSNIALYRIAQKDLDGARTDARAALRLALQIQDTLMIAGVLQHLALLAALRGEVRDAAHLLGYVDVRYIELGYEREQSVQWNYEHLMAALREQLSEAEIETLAAEGAAWSEDRAVEEAFKV